MKLLTDRGLTFHTIFDTVKNFIAVTTSEYPQNRHSDSENKKSIMFYGISQILSDNL